MAYLGEIRMFAGSFVPQGWAQCDGSTLSIQDNPQLADALGRTYGGDGFTTFGLPNLGANAPLHRANVYPMGRTAAGPLGVDAQPAPFLYLIALTTPPDSLDLVPWIGEIRTFASGTVPKGWALCDGSMLSIQSYVELYTIVGNRYGGTDRENVFGLPDLRANTATPTAGSDPLGYVVMNYCIATQGTFPQRSGS